VCSANSDSFDSFVPRDYLNEYYSRIGLENHNLLAFLAHASDRIPMDARMLEFGGGPTIYQLISPAARAGSIDFADYLDSNLDEVRRWLDGSDDAFDWTAFFARSLVIEGLDNGPQARAARAALVRSRITSLRHCDMNKADPMGRGRRHGYDALGAHFVAESITASKPTWRRAVANLTTLLRPGGVLIMSAVLHAEYWRSGAHRYSAVGIGVEDLESLLADLGFLDIDCRTISAEVVDPDDPAYSGYRGMAFITAISTGHASSPEGDDG
jgi:hypothetical protein